MSILYIYTHDIGSTSTLLNFERISWTEDNKNLLRELKLQGVGNVEIAQKLNVDVHSVANKWFTLATQVNRMKHELILRKR